MDERPDAESLRIVRADAQRDVGVLQGGGPVLGMESAAKEALLMAPGRIGMRGGVVRVEQ